MKLTQKALSRINTVKIRRSIAEELNGISDQTVVRYIKANEDNGPLTTIATILVIKKETGLTEEEILEDIKEPEALRA